MTREDDAVAGHLVRRLAEAGGTGDAGCPDDNALGAFVESRLEAHQRTALEGHLAACTSCQAVVAEALALRTGLHSASGPTGASVPALFSVWRDWAVAALVLVALGASTWYFLAARAEQERPDADWWLTTHTAHVRTEHPELFAGFEPLSREERGSIAPTRLRGPLAVLRPAETLLETRPEVTWVAAPGATGYEVILSADGGPVVWRQTVGLVTSAAFPPAGPDLAPGGKYVVRVETRGPLGRSEATRRFTVADEGARARFTKGLAVLESYPLLGAHFAIRRGFLLEAERMLDERLEEQPHDSIAQETLLYVRRRLGVPEP